MSVSVDALDELGATLDRRGRHVSAGADVSPDHAAYVAQLVVNHGSVERHRSPVGVRRALLRDQVSLLCGHALEAHGTLGPRIPVADCAALLTAGAVDVDQYRLPRADHHGFPGLPSASRLPAVFRCSHRSGHLSRSRGRRGWAGGWPCKIPHAIGLPGPAANRMRSRQVAVPSRAGSSLRDTAIRSVHDLVLAGPLPFRASCERASIGLRAMT